jgi:hypothetical protein
MSEPLAPEDFPGPHGLPFVGNVRAIDLAAPIESMMSLCSRTRADLQADLACWHPGGGFPRRPGFSDLRRHSL